MNGARKEAWIQKTIECVPVAEILDISSFEFWFGCQSRVSHPGERLRKKEITLGA